MQASKLKRLLAIVMTLVLTFSVMVQVIAANGSTSSVSSMSLNGRPTYQVNIVPNANTTTPTGELNGNDTLKKRFWAYQIFSGTLGDSNGGASAPLGDVTWGSAITKNTDDVDNIAALLGALKGSGVKASDLGITADMLTDERYESLGSINMETLTLGQIFTAALNADGYTDLTSLVEAAKSADAEALKKLKTGTASSIAGVMDDFTGDNGNANLAEAFAKIVAAKKNGRYLFLDQPEARSRWCGDHERWEIGQSNADGYDDYPQAGNTLSGGYYLITDNWDKAYDDLEGKGNAMSDFIVGVMGDTTLYMKNAGVTSDKKIELENGNKVNASDYELGEEITFLLTGTLPANYANYDEYFYAFHDTMSKGLTFKKAGATVAANEIAVTVYVKVPNPLYAAEGGRSDPPKNYELTEYLYIPVSIDNANALVTTKADYDALAAAGSLNPAKYYIVLTENADGEGATTLDVVFPDLKRFTAIPNVDYENLTDAQKAAIKAEFDGTTETNGDEVLTALEAWLGSASQTTFPGEIANGSTFEVRYKAFLNDNAKTTGPEINTFDLEYSRNPNGSEHGRTTQKQVYVYTFGLDIYKYDSVTGQPLGGAGFVVSKEVEAEEPGEPDDPDEPGESEGGLVYELAKDVVAGMDAEGRGGVETTVNDYTPFYVAESELMRYLNASEEQLKTFMEIMYPWMGGGLENSQPGTNPLLNFTLDNVKYYVTYDDSDVGNDNIVIYDVNGEPYPVTKVYFLSFTGSWPGADDAIKTWPAGTGSIPAEPTEPTTFYAFFAKDEATGKYTVAGWLTEADVAALAGVDSFDQMTKEKWKAIATVTGDKLAEVFADFNAEYADKNTEADTYHIVLMTEDDGKLHTRGLEDESYTLTEVIVPSGYESPDGSIKVEFTADYYTDEDAKNADKGYQGATGTPVDGLLKSLTVKITYPDGRDPETQEIVKDGHWTAAAGSPPSLSGLAKVANIPPVWLPGTGGMGTALYYLTGALFILSSAMLLVFCKKKRLI